MHEQMCVIEKGLIHSLAMYLSQTERMEAWWNLSLFEWENRLQTASLIQHTKHVWTE